MNKFNRGSKGTEGGADGVSDRATKIAALRALTQEVVERTARKGFTPKQRQAVHQMQNGVCGGCEASLDGRFDIDHVIPLWMGGKHEPGNWLGMCQPCHKFKTARDAAQRAHVKRLIENDTAANTPSRFPSRPFPKSTRPLQSRGFDKRRKVMG